MKYLAMTLAAATIGFSGIATADGTKAPSVMTDAQMDNVVAGSVFGDCGHKNCFGTTTFLDYTNASSSDKEVGGAYSSRPDDGQNGFEENRGNGSPNAEFD